MPNPTPRLSLPNPLGTDPVAQLRTSIATAATALDQSATFSQGTIAAIPAPSRVGRRYYATDLSVELYDTGSGWIPLSTPVPIGTIAQWAGNGDLIDPGGVTRWIICDGRNVGRTQYPALFTAIGTTYGTGDGSTTFNIPDGRSRVLVCAGPQTGCTTRTAGQTGGPSGATYVAEETHAVTDAQMGAHSHGGVTGNDSPDHGHSYSDPGHTHAQQIAVNLTHRYNFGAAFTTPGAFGGSSTSSNTTGISFTGATVQHAHSISSDGGGTAHNNMAPFLVVNHVIRIL